MKEKCFQKLVLIVLITVSIVFSAVTAGASCLPEELAASTCLNVGGYELRIVSDSSTPFPIQENGLTTFKYSLIPVGTSKNVSMIDLLVPVCSNTINATSGYPSGWTVYPAGVGSSSTLYGLGVYQYSVFEQTFNSSGKFFLQTTTASSAPTSVGLKIGSKLESGTILGPACYNPKIASVTEQVIQLDPVIHSNATVTLKTDLVSEQPTLLDENGNPVFGKSLDTYPLWVCVDANVQDGHYIDCNSPLSPITHMPDGVMKAGTHSYYIVYSGGKAFVVYYYP